MRKPQQRLITLVTQFLLLTFLIPCTGPIALGQRQDSNNKSTTDGIDLFRQGNTNEAIKVLSKAVKQHADDSEAWYYLGLAFYQEGSIVAARPAFEQLLRLRPYSPSAHA